MSNYLCNNAAVTCICNHQLTYSCRPLYTPSRHTNNKPPKTLPTPPTTGNFQNPAKIQADLAERNRFGRFYYRWVNVLLKAVCFFCLLRGYSVFLLFLFFHSWWGGSGRCGGVVRGSGAWPCGVGREILRCVWVGVVLQHHCLTGLCRGVAQLNSNPLSLNA